MTLPSLVVSAALIGGVAVVCHPYRAFIGQNGCNYTSDPEDGDLSWIDGQTGPTFIYRIDVTFPDPA